LPWLAWPCAAMSEIDWRAVAADLRSALEQKNAEVERLRAERNEYFRRLDKAGLISLAEMNNMSTEGEPHLMSRGAARQLADRMETQMSLTDAPDFVPSIRSEKELHLIVAGTLALAERCL